MTPVAIVDPAGAAAASILFAGDFVLPPDARVADLVAADLLELLRDAELAAVNVEAPIVEREAPAPKVGPHLSMRPEAAKVIRSLGFDVAGLANNHIGDHGAEGVLSTIASCRSAGLRPVGAGTDLVAAATPLTAELRDGTRVAVIALAESEFGIAGEGVPGAAPISGPRVHDLVARVRREHDVVVVMAHGGIEEVPVPPAQRRRQLRGLVEAGADVVIGAHPHVPQGWEVVPEGVVLYSLGDFLVDHPGRVKARDAGYLVGLELRDRVVSRVLVIPHRRDHGMVRAGRLPELERLTGVLGAGEYEGIWQHVALRCFDARYLPFLASLGEAPRAAPEAPRGLRTLAVALSAARPSQAEAPTPPEGWDALLLGDLVRCESLRWTIETATAVRGGLVPDRRTERVVAEAEELLALSGFVG